MGHRNFLAELFKILLPALVVLVACWLISLVGCTHQSAPATSPTGASEASEHPSRWCETGAEVSYSWGDGSHTWTVSGSGSCGSEIR